MRNETSVGGSGGRVHPHECQSGPRQQQSHTHFFLCSATVLPEMFCFALTQELTPFYTLPLRCTTATVANTFVHDERTNLLTVFPERRVKPDSLGCSSPMGQGEKVSMFLQQLCQQQRRWRELYLILEIICASVACSLLSVPPEVLAPRGSTPARHPCCSPCRRWPPEDTFGEWDQWADGGHSAPHQHPGGGKSGLSCLYPQGTWTSSWF